MRRISLSLLNDRLSLAVIVATLLGLLLRFWGAGFGLPQTYHIDELQYVPDAVQYIAKLNFQPSNWANPTFFKYLLALEYAVGYLVSRAVGQIESLSAFQSSFDKDPSVFYLTARLSSAILGTATIPITYGIGAAAYGRKQGLVAGLLLALCFLHARDSHYAVSDVPMTFLFSAAILCCLLYLRQRSSKHLYLAAGLAGLAIATKYTALILVVALAATWAAANYSRRWLDWAKSMWRKEFLVAGVIMALSFLIACPYALLDFRGFLDSLRAHYGMGKIGFAGYQIDPDGSWIFYLKTLIWGMGPVATIAAILSIGYALYKHRMVDILILLPVLVLYVYLGRQRAYFSRFIIPALPLLSVLIAAFLQDISAKFIRLPSGYADAVPIVLSILLVSPSAIAVVRHDVLLTRTDTRTIAKQWIESNMPAGSSIFAEWHSPPLATDSNPMPDSTRIYHVAISDIIGLAEHPLSYYQEQGYQYLIASSFIYDIPRLDPSEDRSRRDLYQQLDREAELIQVFKPYSTENEPLFIFDQIYGPATSLFEFNLPGPTIKIYRLQQ